MKKSLALLALASALPLAAQSFEVSALYTWNKPKSGTFTGGGNSYDFTPDTWKAAGIRFGYTFAKVGITEFQGNATYQFKNTQDYTLKLNGTTVPFPPGTPHLTEAYGYWGVGAAASWAFPVRITAGLEYRSEKLDFDGAGLAPNNSVTYGRLWLRGNVAYDFKNSSSVTPFVAAEFAFPTTSSSADYNQLAYPTNNFESLSKAVAPKSSYGINVGIRF